MTNKITREVEGKVEKLSKELLDERLKSPRLVRVKARFLYMAQKIS